MPDDVVVGTFSDARALVRAVLAVRYERYRVYDVFAPYPVHELAEAMALRPTRMPWVTLFAGAFGCACAAAFQFYTNVLDWPLDVGGKPNNSALAFVPISFELTVLSAGLFSVFALLVRTRLYPGKRVWLAADGVTDDAFALVLRRPDDYFEARRARELLERLGAVSVEEKEGPS